MSRSSPSHDKQSFLDPSTTFFADDFTLSLPSAWQSTTVYRLDGPHINDVQHTIQITIELDVEPRAVADYAAQCIEQKKTVLRGGKVLSQTQRQLDDGSPAYWVSFSLQTPDGERRYQEDCYVLHDGVGYQLSAQFTPETRANMGPVVRSIIDRFSPHLPLSHRR